MNNKSQLIKSIIVVVIFVLFFIFLIKNGDKKQVKTQIFYNPNNQVFDNSQNEINSKYADAYISIARPVVDRALQIWFKKEGDVLDYKINDIKYIIANIYTEEEYKNGYLPNIPGSSKEDIFPSRYSPNAYIVAVDFSVKPQLDSNGHTDWIAGNGEFNQEGWVVNQILYVMIDVIDGEYKAELMGTGL